MCPGPYQNIGMSCAYGQGPTCGRPDPTKFGSIGRIWTSALRSSLFPRQVRSNHSCGNEQAIDARLAPDAGGCARGSGPVLVGPVAAAAEVLGASGSSTSSPEHATPTTNKTASTANTRREGIGAHTKHDPARNDNPTQARRARPLTQLLLLVVLRANRQATRGAPLSYPPDAGASREVR
jgi:hypothetical protein